MDVLQIIKADNDRVRSLLNQLEDTPFKSKAKALELVTDELRRHVKIEETYLYPEIADLAAEKYPGFFDFCIANHRTITRTLTALQKALDDNEAFDKYFQSLKKVVLSHIAAEEDNLMPLMRRYVPTLEREELGIVFEDLKTSSDLLSTERPTPARKRNRA